MRTHFLGRAGDVAEWINPTLADVRATIMDGRMASALSADRPEDIPAARDAALAVLTPTVQAVAAGRLIDLGDMPNTVIRATSGTAASSYVLGVIDHPHREDYVLFHRWEQGGTAYWVRPDASRATGGRFEAAELSCLILRGEQALMLTDRVTIEPRMHAGGTSFLADITEAPLREVLRGVPGLAAETPQQLVGNIGDPVMAGLLRLARRGS